jgi:virginiamycin B lyase
MRRAAAVFAAVVGMLALTIMSGSTPAVATPQVTEIPVPPPGGAPLGIAIGSDHNVWFTELANSAVGRFGGGLTGFSIFPVPGFALPDSIVNGPDGALWFTDDCSSVIWRITTSGSLSSFPIPPCGNGCYNGESGTGNIVAGPDGALWYSRPGNDTIGRITTTGQVHEFPVTPVGPPGWITAGPDGAIWFTVSNGIARMSTNGKVSMVWNGTNYPSSITTGPDGNLWFTGSAQEEVAKLSPGGLGAPRFFHLPLGCSPQEIASGDGSLWVTCYEGPFIYDVTTQGVPTQIKIPSGSEGEGIVQAPNGAMWFTEPGSNRLGRITL